MNNPFSWEYVTTAPGPDDVFDVFGVVCLVIFGVGFLVSLVLSNDGARRYVSHPLKRRLLKRVGGIGTAVCGAGLFFFGVRALQINPFGFALPIWLWLCLLALAALLVYAAYYARVVLPGQLRAYEQQQVKQRYLRPAMSGGSGRARSAPGRAARSPRRRRA